MPETPLTQNAVYSAIPTVQIDGQANDKVTAQLLSIEMREQEGGMSSLEMRLSNFGSFSTGLADLVFEDGAILKLGSAVLPARRQRSFAARSSHLKVASPIAALLISLCLPKTLCKARA